VLETLGIYNLLNEAFEGIKKGMLVPLIATWKAKYLQIRRKVSNGFLVATFLEMEVQPFE